MHIDSRIKITTPNTSPWPFQSNHFLEEYFFSDKLDGDTYHESDMMPDGLCDARENPDFRELDCLPVLACFIKLD